MNGIELIEDIRMDGTREILGFRISAKGGGFGFDVPLWDLVSSEVYTDEKRQALHKRYQEYLADIVKTWEE